MNLLKPILEPIVRSYLTQLKNPLLFQSFALIYGIFYIVLLKKTKHQRTFVTEQKEMQAKKTFSVKNEV